LLWAGVSTDPDDLASCGLLCHCLFPPSRRASAIRWRTTPKLLRL
jgi:hypothetical protein